MGTYIYLSILPNQISRAEWEQVYEESLTLLNAFPFAQIEKREYFGFQVPVYTRAKELTEKDRYWRISGDLQSKQFAESFKLYRDLDKYKTNRKEEISDILLGDEYNAVSVFDSKTQGLNYHLYILAIAMLIESRFPKAALVSGDIDYLQCVKAKQWADQYLSSPIELPVRVHVDSLLNRINDKNELDQIATIEKWLIADAEDIFRLIYERFSREAFVTWFCNHLKTYSSPNMVGAVKLFTYYLNLTNDIDGLINMACKTETGPKYLASDLIRAIAGTWICLPPEKFSFMDVFGKVPGHPHIVERQLGTAMLDMMFTGREIKTYIPVEEVAKKFKTHFPELSSNIDTLLQGELERIEQKLSLFHFRIAHVLQLAEQNTDGKTYMADEDAFLYYDGDSVALTEAQELKIKMVAYAINRFFTDVNADLFKKVLYMQPIEYLKRAFAGYVYEKQNLVLTEEAWQRVVEIDDIHVMRVILAKLIIDDISETDDHKVESDFRKAMLENKKIIEKIIAYMDDEQAMNEVESFIDKN
ncbi:hypothetical protein [Caldifermentibacillus hisashii]|uniref:hypothetical protein n=1 Tax=Caldifermentibacillus hisashii TaxID=996558 RepID=UPI001C10FB8B|nr:hypothetical protein [Caldifermentibacillus hisashii]MBU5342227.1 hypothetical protein [Caldifermentibacillus hisashii]